MHRIRVYYIRNKGFSSNIISTSHIQLYVANAWFIMTLQLYIAASLVNKEEYTNFP